MARYGIPEAGIARVLGIAPEPREHHRAEVDTAPMIADATLDRRRRLLSEG